MNTTDQPTELKPGQRYSKDGVSLDIDAMKDDMVYVRRWPKGVEEQPFFANLYRMPEEEFAKQIIDATLENNP